VKTIPKVVQFNKLVNIVLQRYPELEQVVRNYQELKFTYEDLERDVITISNDEDLIEAFDQTQHPGQTLKIYVSVRPSKKVVPTEKMVAITESEIASL
jgi:hypothetical protein